MAASFGSVDEYRSSVAQYTWSISMAVSYKVKTALRNHHTSSTLNVPILNHGVKGTEYIVTRNALYAGRYSAGAVPAGSFNYSFGVGNRVDDYP